MLRRMRSRSYPSGGVLVEGEGDMLTSELLFSVKGAAAPQCGDAEMGFGRCQVWGCPCRKYEQVYGSDLCKNCGHKYWDHLSVVKP